MYIYVCIYIYTYKRLYIYTYGMFGVSFSYLANCDVIPHSHVKMFSRNLRCFVFPIHITNYVYEGTICTTSF